MIHIIMKCYLPVAKLLGTVTTVPAERKLRLASCGLPVDELEAPPCDGRQGHGERVRLELHRERLLVG
jgi:hypothetical protein